MLRAVVDLAFKTECDKVVFKVKDEVKYVHCYSLYRTKECKLPCETALKPNSTQRRISSLLAITKCWTYVTEVSTE